MFPTTKINERKIAYLRESQIQDNDIAVYEVKNQRLLRI